MPRILIITDYYLPGYKGGGPVRTLSNTVDWLGDEFDFYLLAGDRDFKDSQPYPGVRPGEWMPVGQAQVRYLSPDERRFGALGKIIAGTDYDLLYVNSFFAPMCAKTVLLHGLRRIPQDRPLLLAPRNEFFPAALSLKAWKKRPYLTAIKALGLARRIVWQATSPYEATTIRRHFPAGRVEIAGNLGMRQPPPPDAPPPRAQPLRVVYLSRIDRKKNLIYALQLLRQVQSPLVFDIYGPREDADYWALCEAAMRELPAHVKASYRGEVEHERVLSTFHQYDAFLLPTQGENFGHVIWEALYAGCLPVISDRTPWTDDLRARGIGWAHGLDVPQDFAASLDAIAALPAEDYLRRAQAAQDYARQTVRDNEAVLDANRAMFRALLGDAPGSTHKDG